MREVEIKALLVDPISNTPVILLKDQSSDKVVPVWIGHPEATAIALKLQNKDFPRPLTHDLLKNIMEGLGGKLEKVVIDTIQDATYYATLFVRDREGKTHEIDARPSDSVALALRMASPIFISDEVFELSAIELPFVDEDEQRAEFLKFVEERMRLADFKKLLQ